MLSTTKLRLCLQASMSLEWPELVLEVKKSREHGCRGHSEHTCDQPQHVGGRGAGALVQTQP
ncbi:rCG31111 [Rattus norvegicus]|uniref:RCG31111 n=1 Tax=Rattus norvegicus TaxID=10116 RepID=A6ITB1_RAT|nr:rCG31111 [Rattus norvegicus]